MEKVGDTERVGEEGVDIDTDKGGGEDIDGTTEDAFITISEVIGFLIIAVGGPYWAKSSIIRFFIRLAVTGKTQEVRRGEDEERGEGVLKVVSVNFKVGRLWMVGNGNTSPGQIEFILGRMN